MVAELTSSPLLALRKGKELKHAIFVDYMTMGEWDEESRGKVADARGKDYRHRVRTGPWIPSSCS
jgi:hypothetical protein